MNKSIWVIAHRGAFSETAKNAMAAFHRALDLGARYIEASIQFSGEGQFVCIHETNLDHTTSSAGDVIQHPLEQLCGLVADAKCHPRFAGEHIPTLDEPEDLHLAIEAGVDGVLSDHPDRVVAALRG
jgi:glycerophosphoryl diester phosphodiesterase